MGSIITVIVILVIIGSSILKGIKKFENAELEKTTLPGHKSGREIHFPQNAPVAATQPTAKKKMIKTSVAADKQSVSTPISIMEESVPEGRAFLDIDDHDEIRKAIIYSEIFTRKQY
ncbi:MAG: hypothetical protein LBS25_08220 [Candidatus Symbiothrix sp.]|jgi:hypothetical protein|nr:hypothetical protein [Candidatus Symbiothrix sp.]